MDLLRLITAGSVDDGKSTLIGRLLFDSKSIMIDQLEAIERQTKSKLNGNIDLALLTDGLRAEREQGITIDVAYKYFSIPRRKFILADAPGHIQYTRNMITGASNVDLIIILIDARKGVIEQTRRHSIIASLLGIKNVLVAINKMDLMNFSEDIFLNIVLEYSKISQKLGLQHVQYIPISALNGDNIVEKSVAMSWYKGESLLTILENIDVNESVNSTEARLPVQYVIRPQTEELPDYRGYAGKITSGFYKVGDPVIVLPAGLESTIKSIQMGGLNVDEAFAFQSVVLQLTDELDITRGSLIVKRDQQPQVSQDINVQLCWMDNKPLKEGNKYLLQLNSSVTKCMVKEILYKLDVNTLERLYNPGQVNLNEIIGARLQTATPIASDNYHRCKATGSAILIDETTHSTVGACMIQ